MTTDLAHLFAAILATQKRRRGGPRKYSSEEERKEATRATHRRWYARKRAAEGKTVRRPLTRLERAERCRDQYARRFMKPTGDEPEPASEEVRELFEAGESEREFPVIADDGIFLSVLRDAAKSRSPMLHTWEKRVLLGIEPGRHMPKLKRTPPHCERCQGAMQPRYGSFGGRWSVLCRRCDRLICQGCTDPHADGTDNLVCHDCGGLI